MEIKILILEPRRTLQDQTEFVPLSSRVWSVCLPVSLSAHPRALAVEDADEAPAAAA